METDKNNTKTKFPEDGNVTEFNFDTIKLKGSTLDFENNLTKHSLSKAVHIVVTKLNVKKIKLAELLIIQYEICNDLNERMFIPINKDDSATKSLGFSYEYLHSTIETIISLSELEQKQYISSIVKDQYILFSKWFESTGFIGDKSHARNQLLQRGCQKMHRLNLDDQCSDIFGIKRFKSLLMSIEELNERKLKKMISKEKNDFHGSKRLSKKDKRELRQSDS